MFSVFPDSQRPSKQFWDCKGVNIPACLINYSGDSDGIAADFDKAHRHLKAVKSIYHHQSGEIYSNKLADEQPTLSLNFYSTAPKDDYIINANLDDEESRISDDDNRSNEQHLNCFAVEEPQNSHDLPNDEGTRNEDQARHDGINDTTEGHF